MAAVTHIAGLNVTVQDRYLRQRCAWCGVVLLDYDLANIQVAVVPGEEPTGPATWPVGELVTVNGGVSFSLEAGSLLPDDACALAHPELTL